MGRRKDQGHTPECAASTTIAVELRRRTGVQGAYADADRPTLGAPGADHRRPHDAGAVDPPPDDGPSAGPARPDHSAGGHRAIQHVTAWDLLVTKATVGKWRSRFVRDGLHGVLDAPRPGAPRQISGAHVEAVITRTLESTPRDATHWSTRSMANATALSQSAISRIWSACALQPHRVETFKLSKDPCSSPRYATS